MKQLHHLQQRSTHRADPTITLNSSTSMEPLMHRLTSSIAFTALPRAQPTTTRSIPHSTAPPSSGADGARGLEQKQEGLVGGIDHTLPTLALPGKTTLAPKENLTQNCLPGKRGVVRRRGSTPPPKGSGDPPPIICASC